MAENGTTTRMAILQGETILMPCKAYSLGQRTVRYSFFFFFFFCNDDVWSLRIDICGTEPSYPCNAPTFRLFSLHYIKVFELLTEREEKKGRKKGRKMDGMSSLSLSWGLCCCFCCIYITYPYIYKLAVCVCVYRGIGFHENVRLSLASTMKCASRVVWNAAAQF